MEDIKKLRKLYEPEKEEEDEENIFEFNSNEVSPPKQLRFDTNSNKDIYEDYTFQEILPKFYLGPKDVLLDQYKRLRKTGVTHILTVAAELAVPFGLDPDDYIWKQIKINDLAEDANILFNSFEEAFNFIEEARKEKNGGILVHCNQGVSRSAAIVIGYLMKKEKLSFENAYQFVKAKRKCISPIQPFQTQLKLLQK